MPDGGHHSGRGSASPAESEVSSFPAASPGVPGVTGAQYVLLFQSKALLNPIKYLG